MRIISFCAMVCFLLISYVVLSRSLDDLRREIFYTLIRAYHSSSRKIPAQGTYGRYSDHGVAIYATYRSSQPPDYRTYSPEVTSSRSNLPVHRNSTRRCVSSRADLLIIKENPLDVKRIFSVFYKIFQKFLEVIPFLISIIFVRTCA